MHLLVCKVKNKFIKSVFVCNVVFPFCILLWVLYAVTLPSYDSLLYWNELCDDLRIHPEAQSIPLSLYYVGKPFLFACEILSF